MRKQKMLRYMKEYRKYVDITGYQDVSFDKAESFLKANRKQNPQDVSIQFFDAELIATQEHLYFAILNTLEAFKNKTNVSKSPAMETMLYSSAQRQIQRAIDRCGIKPQTTKMAVILIGEDPGEIELAVKEIAKTVGAKPDISVLEMTKDKEEKIIKAFEITEEELRTVMKVNRREKAIVNLVIERVALLSTQL
jgi:tRNA threonylcarbamoyladenosine modification (KEOPS) complex Cgi121 subunit